MEENGKDKKKVGFWRWSEVASGFKSSSDVPGKKTPLSPCRWPELNQFAF